MYVVIRTAKLKETIVQAASDGLDASVYVIRWSRIELTYKVALVSINVAAFIRREIERINNEKR